MLIVFFQDITIIIQLIYQGGEKREVISVWGMDAPRKTNLVRIISHELSGCFDRHAFVSVLHPFDLEVLLNSLLLQLSTHDPAVEDNLETLEAEDSIKKLAMLLKGQKYLIAIDGILSTAEWNSIESCLPAEENGSRVVLTTTEESVAVHCSVERRNTYKLEAVTSDGEVGTNSQKVQKS